MDKKSLNNEIIRMRPEANRAKVHTISKLNKEVKRLRVQKSYQSEAQMQKNLHKAERLVEELLLMKKLKHDEITKFALGHSKSAAAAILSNQSASPESKCLSRLAQHMGLATRVESFRTQFPNWETTLVSLMASIGVKVKRSKVVAKSLGLLTPKIKLDNEPDGNCDEINSTEDESNIEQVEGDITSNDSDREDEIEADSDSETDNSIANLGQHVESDSSDVRSLEDDPSSRLEFIPKGKHKKVRITNVKRSLKSDHKHEPTSKKKVFQEKSVDHMLIAHSDEDEPKPHVNLKKDGSSKFKSKKNETSKKRKEIDVCGEIKTVGKSSNSTIIKEVKMKVIANRSREMKVMKFTELLGSTTSMDLVIESNNGTLSKSTTKTVDSFFVTEDGKSEFLSTVSLKEPTVEQKPVNYAPQEVYDSSGRRLNRREIRSRLHGNKSFKGFSSRPSMNKNRSNKWTPADVPATSKWRDTTAQLQPKVFLPPVVDEPLHPSWEAKKKQKEQLNTVFKGTKIKFDD